MLALEMGGLGEDEYDDDGDRGASDQKQNSIRLLTVCVHQ